MLTLYRTTFFLILFFSGSALASQQLETSKIKTESNASTLEMTQKKIEEWGLSIDDWNKYEEIMKGPTGIWSPDIDPITALGINAINSLERERYAKIWLQMESKRIEGILAFEAARKKVGTALFKDKKSINDQQFVDDWNNRRSQATTVARFFVSVDCIDDCREKFLELYSSFSVNSRIDIFFAGSPSTSEIGRWGRLMDITPAEVSSKKITLNYDKGEFRDNNIKIDQVPEVVVVRSDTKGNAKHEKLPF